MKIFIIFLAKHFFEIFHLKSGDEFEQTMSTTFEFCKKNLDTRK